MWAGEAASNGPPSSLIWRPEGEGRELFKESIGEYAANGRQMVMQAKGEQSKSRKTQPGNKGEPAKE
eukprot:1529601-Rhodomonas_salina.1